MDGQTGTSGSGPAPDLLLPFVTVALLSLIVLREGNNSINPSLSLSVDHKKDFLSIITIVVFCLSTDWQESVPSLGQAKLPSPSLRFLQSAHTSVPCEPITKTTTEPAEVGILYGRAGP